MFQEANAKRLILITGASSGIGATFARHFAKAGHPLILAARSADKLQALARELESVHQPQIRTIALDLTNRGSAQNIFDEVERSGIHLYGLINNAGCGIGGKFLAADRERILRMIDLNVKALVELTHLFLPGMLKRKKGFMINVSSTAGFQPTSYLAAYAASKAFVTSFSEALWLETKNSGVQILNLCPGLTKTPFGTTAGMRDFHKDPWAQNPEEVVAAAIKGLNNKVPTVISGFRNQILVFCSRLIPHGMLLWAVHRIQEWRKRDERMGNAA